MLFWETGFVSQSTDDHFTHCVHRLRALALEGHAFSSILKVVKVVADYFLAKMANLNFGKYLEVTLIGWFKSFIFEFKGFCPNQYLFEI